MYQNIVEYLLVLIGGVCLISSQQAPGRLSFIPQRRPVVQGGPLPRIPTGNRGAPNQRQFPTGRQNPFQQPNVQQPPRQVPNGRVFPQSQFPIPQSQRQQVAGQLPSGRIPTRRIFPQGSRIPTGNILRQRPTFPQGRIPQQRPSFPQGQVPQRQFPQGQIPQRQYQQGQIPQRQFPQGQIPQRQFPQGQIPQRQFPQGQIPQRQFPQGQVPRQQPFPGQPPRRFPTSPQGLPQVVGNSGSPIARMPRTGPNRCGDQCCPGWAIRPGTQLCIIPKCRSPCGFGYCRTPNLCRCFTGGFGSSCPSMGGGCQCQNGGRCEGSRCVCPLGYAGLRCEQAICKEPCLNNGRCIGPDRCACSSGFHGVRCEYDNRVGYCFTRIENNMCRGQLQGVKCSRDSCCGTVGKAWGIQKCQKCPEKRECELGYFKNPKTGKCEDINECKGLPNICSMGTCINTMGSYRCACGPGRLYNPEKLQCEDIDECKLNSGLCEFGRCENIDGDFKCVCNDGYTTQTNGKRCIEIQTKSEVCYLTYFNGRCSNGGAGLVTKSTCCCGKPSHAYGTSCTQCPLKGSASYRALGCSDDKGNIGEGGNGKDGVGDGGEVKTTDEKGDNKGDGDDGKVTTDGDTGKLINECKHNPGLCEFGTCVNVKGGDFECKCNAGYKPTADKKRCQEVESFNNCFDFAGGACNFLTNGQFSKQRCCCGNPTRAFGRCNKCPAKGEAQYRALVCDDDEGNIGEGGDGKGGVGDGDNSAAIDECKENSGLCEFGKCSNVPGGSFKCTCNPGYVTINDGKRCVAVQKFDKCYKQYSGGICVDPFRGQNSKKECCCGQPERAFGNCNQCPRKGTVGYRELGCADDEGNIGEGGKGKNGVGDKTTGKDGSDGKDGKDGTGKDGKDGNGKDGSGKDGDGKDKTDGSGKTEIDETVTKDADKECKDIFEKCSNGRCVDSTQGKLCLCNRGYDKNKNNACGDVNECVKYGYCHGGKCINTKGSFECSCPSGYEQSDDKVMCKDVNECDTKGICGKGSCENLVGSFHCRCEKGFTSHKENMTCVDENECLKANICPNNGKCVNTYGSYKCECGNGFKRNEDNICIDINECKTIQGICKHGHCENSDGSFRCVCPSGFEVSDDGMSCVDVDECKKHENICYGGTCINGVGSFRCKCDRGFHVAKEGTYCIDMREENCYAKHDGFNCQMPLMKKLTKLKCCCGMENTGMRAWGSTCMTCPKKGTNLYKKVCMNGPGIDAMGNDIDECVNNAGMALGMCKNGRCMNLMKDFKCVCNSGFKNAPGSNKVCVDINECTEFNYCQGGECKNTEGGFQCTCPDGFDYNYETSTCEDRNECDQNPCIGGTCVNKPGSFECKCPFGSNYDAKRKICIDQREGNCFSLVIGGKCDRVINTFVSKSECCNSRGKAWGPNCEPCDKGSALGCKAGYKRVGTQCVDIDECQFSGTCPNGVCKNTIGSYVCNCPQGYELSPDSTGCVDKRTGVCYREFSSSGCGMVFEGEIFTRANCCCGEFSQAWGSPCEECPIQGSPDHTELCSGGAGFEKKGVDMDECKINGMCKNGKCINLEGSFKCECNLGYGLDKSGTMCVDLDECEISKGTICGPGKCVNTIGSFQCDCFSGYRNDMMMEMCVDINECREMNPSPCRGGTCINSEGSFRCECPKGLRTMGDSIACEDVDECEENPDICPNGQCQNFIGSYQCSCNVGFSESRDMLQCIDIDECNTNNGGCEYSCENTPGSFKCGCRPGFELTIDRKHCKDVNECDRGTPCGLGNQCTNTIGGHICTCASGYRVSADAKLCVDVDECIEDPNACQNGQCINTAGSFICKCRSGYKLEENAMACVDVDECAAEPNGGCHPDASCFNKVGSFTCLCKAGYEGDGQTCVDTNECQLGQATCAQDAECKNTIGSYVCQCKEGFNGDGEVCIDTNECADDRTLCQPGTCMNTIGGYKCDCPIGYGVSRDGKSCLDKNECLEDNVCDHGYCLNNQGSYTCRCELGFQTDKTKTKCVDVNECETSGMCPNGVCKNMMGMYKCICDKDKGFMPNANETGCIDMRMGTCMSKYIDENTCGGVPLSTKKLMKQFCCCTSPDGTGWRESETGVCEACPSMTSDEYKALCPGGTSTHVNETTNKIIKHNGCDVLENYCLNGECVDTGVQGLSCKCKTGAFFNATSLQCQDTNECLQDGICGFGAQCINTEGGYRCQCPENSEFDEVKKFCKDTNNYQCFAGFMNPSGGCTNPIPSEITTAKCCCGAFAMSRYGADCKACPVKGSGQYNALCIGKPKEEIKPTGQPPIGPTKPPVTTPSTGGGGTGTGTGGTGTGTGGTGTGGTGTGTGGTGTGGTGTGTGGTGTGTGGTGTGGTGTGTGTGGTGTGGTGTGTGTGGTGTGTGGTGTGGTGTGTGTGGTGTGGTGTGTGTGGTGTGTGGTGTGGTGGTGTGGTGTGGTGTGGTGTGGTGTGGTGTGGTGTGTGGTGTGTGGTGPTIDPENDMDECVVFPGICGKGKCENLIGSYRCICDLGYQEGKKGLSKTCIDENECKQNPCTNGTCTNFAGGFYCTCPNGMELAADSNTLCVDLNECTTKGYCENGKCTNYPDGKGFDCQCDSGFMKTIDGKSCEDMDECLMPDICKNGMCINNIGSYECKCNIGYLKNEENGMCVDRDECVEFAGQVCDNGKCNNLDGSYFCSCNDGFRQNSNKKGCEDIDECEDPTFCTHGTCTNLPGSATCQCLDGFEKTADGRSCEDINECLATDPPCEFGGSCVNTPGGFRCLCQNGFVADFNGRSCIDTRLSYCFSQLENNQCVLANGLNISKATCCCSMGAGWGDPCELCPEKGTKEFEYYCPNGLGLTKNNTDINECEANLGQCINGNCVNTDGSFRCECRKGYVNDPNNPLQCIDRDECSEQANVCGKGACKNLDGSYECVCPSGFRAGPGSKSCDDINECSEDRDICAFRCKNIIGSYYCTCPRGFKLSDDKKHCDDINECETPGICLFRCKNVVGRHLCLCPDGYRRDARGQCLEINECTEDRSLCKPGGVCQNTKTGYRCDCTPPFMRSANGNFCEDKGMGLCFSNAVDGICQGSSKKMEKVTQRDCCCTGGGKAWGRDCRLCPAPNSAQERSMCIATQNRTINECEFVAGICSNGKCMDTVDSFRCMCNKGYKLTMDGKACVDTDECAEGKHACPGECKNTKGSYECLCPKGYIINEAKTACVDEDECSTGNHNCPHKCENTKGGFKCVCPNGYKRVMETCIDVNECEDPGICGLGRCNNLDGSYECICGRGLEFDPNKKACVYITGPGPDTGGGGDGNNNCIQQGVCGAGCQQGTRPHYNIYGLLQCVDINECRQNMCGGSSCVNTLGSYQCQCQGGYSYQYGGGCQDVNECAQNPCSYGCSNNRGGFSCQCPPGYFPSQGGHCFASHGMTCLQCDTADIPSEGLPLDTGATQTQLGPATLVGDGTAPLVTGGGGQTLLNYQFNPRQQGGGYYGGGYGGGTGYVNPYGMYSYRQRRSIRRSPRAIGVKFSQKSKVHTRVFQFAPILKGLHETMEYSMERGNTTAFALGHDKHGRTYVETIVPVEVGLYNIVIKGKIHETGSNNTKSFKERFGALNFKTRVVVTVIP